MKKILILAAIAVTLNSCKKSTIIQSVIDTDIPLSEVQVSVVGPKILNSQPYPPVLDTYNFLGYGYDLTGKYADTSAVRAKAINIALYAADNPGRYELDRSKQSDFYVINAENAESFSRKLSFKLSETNGFSFFKGSLTSPFPGSDALSKKYVYGSYFRIIRQRRVKIMQNYDLLKNYLTSEVIRDVQFLSPEDLVKKYGSHILSDIGLGAKLNVTYQAEISTKNRLAAETAGFTFALRKVFGLSTGYVDAVKASDLKGLSSMKIVYDAVGADLSKLVENRTTKTPTIDINNWHLSSTEDGAVFIDVFEGGLIPIYELVADPSKKAQIKSYVAAYLSEEQVKLPN